MTLFDALMLSDVEVWIIMAAASIGFALLRAR